MIHIFVVETKRNDVDRVKDCAKTSGKDNGDANFDCWVPRPLKPSPPSLVEVTTNQNVVDSVKVCANTSGKDGGDASSDCWVPHDPFRPSPPSVAEVATKQLG